MYMKMQQFTCFKGYSLSGTRDTQEKTISVRILSFTVPNSECPGRSKKPGQLSNYASPEYFPSTSTEQKSLSITVGSNAEIRYLHQQCVESQLIYYSGKVSNDDLSIIRSLHFVFATLMYTFLMYSPNKIPEGNGTFTLQSASKCIKVHQEHKSKNSHTPHDHPLLSLHSKLHLHVWKNYFH